MLVKNRLRELLIWTRRLVRSAARRDRFWPIRAKVRTIELGSFAAAWRVVPELCTPRLPCLAFGVGTDISFELALCAKTGCKVHLFDPTPRSVKWISQQLLPAQVTFQDVGIAAHDGTAVFAAPADPTHVSYYRAGSQASNTETVSGSVLRLQSIMAGLAIHDVSLLKLDVEGSEYEVIHDICQCAPQLRQVAIEFHHGMHEYTLRDTERAVSDLEDAGLHLAAVSPSGKEFLFVRLPRPE